MSSDVLNIPEEERELFKKSKKHGLPRPPLKPCKHSQRPGTESNPLKSSVRTRFNASLASPPKTIRKSSANDKFLSIENQLPSAFLRKNMSTQNLLSIKQKSFLKPSAVESESRLRPSSHQMFYTQKKAKAKKQIGYSNVQIFKRKK